ncbi:MAG: hypothetical protein Q7K21_07665 [Elusimicrobiota bacterium]|nr:hypothetical protein [Elusimicrobiota bacterium]
MKHKNIVGYEESLRNKEVKLSGWKGKQIYSATVIHTDSEGYLTVRFKNGTEKKYGYNDLGFWEILKVRDKKNQIKRNKNLWLT